MADLLGKDYTPPDIYGKVTGRAKYAEDFRMDGMLFCRLLKSPMPHCRVRGVDADAALAMDGVVAILRADDVRDQLGFTGAGVKIGVISNGADSRQSAVNSGDLPPGIEIDPSRPGSDDEGTAMLEIVHDLAPDALLAFSGPRSSAEMVQSVNWLANSALP